MFSIKIAAGGKTYAVVSPCFCLAVVPLLLLFCLCGSAAGVPGGFTEMPYDTKSHLINYHTEGQGENTVMYSRNMWPVVSHIT